jgi:membrane protease YdiL (CAAX protease family)
MNADAIALDPRAQMASIALMGVFAAMLAAVCWAAARLLRGEPLLAQEPPRVVPWGAWSLLAVILMYLGLLSLIIVLQIAVAGDKAPRDAGTATAAAPATGAKAPATDNLRAMALMTGLNLAILALVPPLLHSFSGARASDLGLSRSRLGRDTVAGIVAFLAGAPLCYLVMWFATKLWPPRNHPLQQMLQADGATRTFLFAVVAAVVVGPLVEEFLFRGVLLPALAQIFDGLRETNSPGTRPGPTEGIHDPLNAGPGTSQGPPRALAGVQANLLTSVLFAGLHAGQWPAPVPLFVLSMVLGHLTLRTGRIWPACIMHACFNLFSLCALQLVRVIQETQAVG